MLGPSLPPPPRAVSPPESPRRRVPRVSPTQCPSPPATAVGGIPGLRSQSPPPRRVAGRAGSLSGEIRELFELMKCGALTEPEFLEAKLLVLARHRAPAP
eukprot:Hpha_TRINITY_DN21534_c0_g1::TRINITY_DN21534_c0_g1_i1::g.54::m.54